MSARRLSGEKSALSSVKWAEELRSFTRGRGDEEASSWAETVDRTNLRDLTCEGEEHPSGTEQVVAALSKREDHAEGAQDHEEEAEDGDGRCRDVVLWGRGTDHNGRRQMIKTCRGGWGAGIVYIMIISALHWGALGQMISLWISSTWKRVIRLNRHPKHLHDRWGLWNHLHRLIPPFSSPFYITSFFFPVNSPGVTKMTLIGRQTAPGFCLFSLHHLGELVSCVLATVLAQLLQLSRCLAAPERRVERWKSSLLFWSAQMWPNVSP